MKIVLSNNRVIAYGGEYIAMGVTVVCKTTGKVYQNATVAECETVPCDIDRVGYEYRAGVFTPCAPYGMDNGEGYIMVACRECATPKNSGRALDDILGARLNIAAEFGSQIACYKNNRVEYPKEISPGHWRIDLPEYGEWVVKATLGDVTGEQIVNVDILKEYFAYFGYVISVDYPAEAVCTCSQGETVLTAPNTSGAATFVVYAPGAWDITITDGEETRSVAVQVKGEANESQRVKMNFIPEARMIPEEGFSYTEGINHLSWETVKEYAKAVSKIEVNKNASAVYITDANTFTKISIGDTKNFVMDGLTYNARIIGFNHDNVANSDSYGRTKAGLTFESVELYPDTMRITNKEEEEIWINSELRTVMISAFNTAETALKNVVVSVKKKYEDDFYEIALSTETVFALSAAEYATVDVSHQLNTDEGEQYAFYAAGNSLVKKINGGSNRGYWTRTCATDEDFHGAVVDGKIDICHKDNFCSFAVAFCI